MECDSYKPEEHGKIIVVLDFDGTLYRGLFARLFNGIANVDMLIMLCIYSLTEFTRFYNLVRAGYKVMRLRYSTMRSYRKNQLSLSDADALVVEAFVKEVLLHVTPAKLTQTVGVVAKYCYKSAWTALASVRDCCDFFVVSKSFDCLLKQVSSIALGHDICLQYAGTSLCYNTSGWKIGNMVTKAGKAARVSSFLKKNNYSRAVIIGDTEDDIAMSKAAADHLGKEKVTLIAFKPCDKVIATTADYRVGSWSVAGPLLQFLADQLE